MASAVICSCGLIKQARVGTHVVEGVPLCNACGLPITIGDAARAPVKVSIRPDMMTTLASLPGYRTVEVLGVVTELSATSGLTATMKGTSALTAAMAALRDSAAAMGATAILGLTACAFGAAGGITSAFGGDAVGVLLMGTAVMVEAEATPSI